MSWAAHQFEGYVLQKHFGSKVRISYLAIVAGDLLPDKFVKSWVYGFTIDGHHFGANDPAHFHRGWPGAGFTHTMFMGVVVGTLVWFFGRHRAWGVPWGIGIVIGTWAHVLTDAFDTEGTMLLFPFSTHRFSLGAWAYAAPAGRNGDAAVYLSSLGFIMDVTWLLILLIFFRQALSRMYFAAVVRPADAGAWRWMSRFLSADAQYAVYLAMFGYGLARLISWSFYAHVLTSHAYDFTWGGPHWYPNPVRTPQSLHWAIVGVVGVTTVLTVFTKLVLNRHRLPDAEAPRLAQAAVLDG